MIFDEPDAARWGIGPQTLDRWHELTPGTDVTVVKRSAKYDGEIRAGYPGLVITSSLPSPWVEIEATWTLPDLQHGPLLFENGDTLREAYSPIHPYDSFAVYTPAGALKGWYANVTWPARLAWRDGTPEVTWRDLFIDIAATPDGTYEVLDEDELEEFDMTSSDPALHRHILAARDELLERFVSRRPPFHRSTP